jgi:uncharacterized protein YndB with AHSA1/START domain
MIDVSQQINSVRREVGTRVLEAGEARTVTISQNYRAPIDDVWDACTNAERIPRWFLPISGDLRVGGRYQLEGNAGGTVEACDPPHSFRATWEFGGGVTWIEVRLASEADGRTRLEIEHIAHVDDGTWLQFGPGAVGVGWDMALVGMALHLGSPSREPVDRGQAAAWMASEDGKRFVSASSVGWREANVAAGEDVAVAGEAAQRTTDAYTGVPS